MKSECNRACLAFALLISLCTSLSGQSPEKLHTPGQKLEKELNGGEIHSYSLPLSANQFISITTIQKGIDVVVSLKAPDGKDLLSIDSPNGPNGPEPLWYVTESGGEFTMVISSLEKAAKPGKYEIQLNNILPADEDLRRHSKASNLAIDGINIMAARLPGAESLAISKFEEAARLYEQIETNVDAKGAGFLRLARAYKSSRRAETAIEFFDRAAAVYEKAGRKLDAAKALMETPSLTWSEAERLRRNSRINALAVEIGDKNIEIGSLMNMAGDHYSLGDFSEAIRVNFRALQLATETKDPRLAGIHDNMGIIYTAKNDFASALEWHSKALETLQDRKSRSGVASARLNIGNVYKVLGQHHLALDAFETALTEFEDQKAPLGTAYATSNIGVVHLANGDPDKAIEYLEKARSMKARIMPLDAESFINLADAYRSKQNYSRSVEFAEQAIEVARKTSDNFLLANAFLVKAEALQLGGDSRKALNAVAEFKLISAAHNYPQLQWRANLAAAKSHLSLNDVQSAHGKLTEAVNEIELLEQYLTLTDESVSSFFADKREPFEMLISLELSRSNIPTALVLAEKTKAKALIRSVSGTRVESGPNVSLEDLAAERTMMADLAALHRRINESKAPELSDTLKAQLHKKRLELEDFRLRLRGKYPQLRIMRGHLQPMTLSQAGGMANNDRGALVEYVITANKAFIFVLTNGTGKQPQLQTRTIDLHSKDLSTVIEQYRAKLSAGDLGFTDKGRELYDILLKPIAAQLARKTNIVIVPDGPLWDLPFQALMDEKGKFLAEKIAVSYAPSLTALNEMKKKAASRRSKRSAGAELIAFGNPILSNETSTRVKRVFMNEKLEPLPEAERLVNGLSKIYGAAKSKVYVGAAAREEVAKKEVPNYRVVQFATHGILNNLSPMYSHLVFAKDDKNPNEDGLLEAWELKDLELNADMVILSACDTARGRISAGEGIIGMTWASFIAGAPSTVASQWKVESSSTTELMLEFHRQLLSGKVSKAEALRRAQLKLMRDPKYRHPSYWGAWVIVGDAS